MRMNNINSTQVQQTNDASTVSKCSAVCKNYFSDNFIHEFVDKEKSRASLIHLGYYTRAVVISKFIAKFIKLLNDDKFLKFQIISCGSGFDTTYWRFSEENLLNNSLFVEIDFSNVIKKKISMIKQSQKLQSYLHEWNHNQGLKGIHKMNFNYYLLEADLSDLDLLEKLFNNINIAFDIPTLFLSECVITYMREPDSSKLIRWMADRFRNCGLLIYEQIQPYDGFGQVMLKHFDKLQSSLFSVSKYPDCESHRLRYNNLGFESSHALSEWDALIWLTTEDERRRVLCLELFDEFEEFHLKCVHYVVGFAGNGISSRLINFIPQLKEYSSFRVTTIKASAWNCDLELFRHFSCSANENTYVFGGCNRQRRSSKIYKITYKNNLDIKKIQYSGNSSIELDVVYGSVVYFELNKVPFACLYGGRTSPDKICNRGSPVLFEVSEDKFILRMILNEGKPIPRYRTQMVSLNSTENEVYCWVFGGRTAHLDKVLSDLWRLSIKYDTASSKRNLSYSWTQYESKGNTWPHSRISHSFTACPKRLELFVVGGLTADSCSALNDMWKWCCRSESWERMRLVGKLLPRYGHTAHLKDDVIYLVGGVNTLAGRQPGLATIDLVNLTVTEYDVSVAAPEPFLLFNHTSQLLDYGDHAFICVLGGGGNCFSFGTHLNRFALRIKLSCLS